MPAATIRRQISDIIWAIVHRVHPSHQYHLIRLDGLRPGYHDIDVRMLHGVMSLVVSYVEAQRGGSEKMRETAKELRAEFKAQPWGGESTEQHLENQLLRDDRIIQIYEYWTKTRPMLIEKEEALLLELFTPGAKPFGHASPSYSELAELRERLEREDTDFMIEAVKLRGSMWV